jgi:hypothetical protein
VEVWDLTATVLEQYASRRTRAIMKRAIVRYALLPDAGGVRLRRGAPQGRGGLVRDVEETLQFEKAP